ncbi:RtcB family protein [Pseudonocardia sp.]|uniref:RtcB family protein n=1 Tax=Pseudonocardia sp. TaxID=60912 RepID=UPI00260A2368|nr:RtcB family protein [Pseudonocardia sp.]
MQQIAKGLLNWASILEEKTRAQALQTAGMPFVRPHVALMPDAHLGMGSTVGSVIPTVRAVMPATVGADIGCGMAAVRTQLTRADVDARPLGALREAIEAAVPPEAMVGIEWRAENAEAFLDEIPRAYKDIDQVMEDAKDLVRIDHTLRQVLNVKGD